MVGTHGGAAMTSRDVGLGLRVLILNLGRSLGTGFRITIAVESAPAGSSSGSMDTAKVGDEFPSGTDLPVLRILDSTSEENGYKQRG